MAGVFCPRFFRGLGKGLGPAPVHICLLDIYVLTDTFWFQSFWDPVGSLFSLFFNMLCIFMWRACVSRARLLYFCCMDDFWKSLLVTFYALLKECLLFLALCKFLFFF